MRMISVNVLNTISTLSLARKMGAKRYFCVSTDKAANPVNMMGASKRIMEMFLMRESLKQSISMARFANVAFSDGSLFVWIQSTSCKRQPLAAPNDIRRYFITPKESGELCLFFWIIGREQGYFFPKLSNEFLPITFSELAVRFLTEKATNLIVWSENEARDKAEDLISKKKWPCYFFKSDTTGEKEVEEFFLPIMKI